MTQIILVKKLDAATSRQSIVLCVSVFVILQRTDQIVDIEGIAGYIQSR
jgi:hypothetical protein